MPALTYDHKRIASLAELHPEWSYRQIADAYERSEGMRPTIHTVQYALLKQGLTKRERLGVADVDITILQGRVERLERELAREREARIKAEEERDCIRAESANTRRAARRAMSDAETVTGYDPRRLLELIGAIVWAEQDEADFVSLITDSTYLGAMCEIPLRPDDVQAIREGRGRITKRVDRRWAREWERQGGQTACKQRLKEQGVTGRDRLIQLAELERDQWIAAQVEADRWPWDGWPRG